MKLYEELAEWWPLLSAPADYEEEAGLYASLLHNAADGAISTLLELGSGGGNNASFMKHGVDSMTLVDLSPGMLDVSRVLNPECEHVVGDMRSVRLDRTFDAVFVHDAICYMTTLSSLRAAMETAFIHCRPGGVALFAPDYVKEAFEPETSQGGHDGPDRALRYLAWTWDPDPDDDSYLVDYAYILRSPDDTVRVEHDRHVEGLFARQVWLDTLSDVGFHADAHRFEHSEVDWELVVFVCRRPGGGPGEEEEEE